MVKINDNFLKLPGGYLFPEIGRRVGEFSATNPPKPLIRLGIGDVTQPLAPAVIEAMHKATDEMSRKETFRGYCDDACGYDFLRSAVCDFDYKARGVSIGPDEICISDGAKSDCGNIGDIFSVQNRVAICDPVYPAYVDTTAMAGRAGTYGKDDRWSDIVYLPCTEENGFFPSLPDKVPDLIYICSPNNPTGTAATEEQLKIWVDYANEHESVILFDGAYEAFITEPEIPHSIFEIPGAETCAIEFRSFSKTAGFTGNTLCLHRHSECAQARRRFPARSLGPPAVNEVQRHALCRTARRRSRLLARGTKANQSNDRLLSEQCKSHPGRFFRCRPYCLRRNQRAVQSGRKHQTACHPGTSLICFSRKHASLRRRAADSAPRVKDTSV